MRGGGVVGGFTFMVLSLDCINYEESVTMKMDCRQEGYIVTSFFMLRSVFIIGEGPVPLKQLNVYKW